MRTPCDSTKKNAENSNGDDATLEVRQRYRPGWSSAEGSSFCSRYELLSGQCSSFVRNRRTSASRVRLGATDREEHGEAVQIKPKLYIARCQPIHPEFATRLQYSTVCQKRSTHAPQSSMSIGSSSALPPASSSDPPAFRLRRRTASPLVAASALVPIRPATADSTGSGGRGTSSISVDSSGDGDKLSSCKPLANEAPAPSGEGANSEWTRR